MARRLEIRLEEIQQKGIERYAQEHGIEPELIIQIIATQIESETIRYGMTLTLETAERYGISAEMNTQRYVYLPQITEAYIRYLQREHRKRIH